MPTWTIRGRQLDLSERPWVMGVLNVTPDSFSDGGEFLDPGRAVARGREMAAEGADIIDIGGESTRPGARPVPEDEELQRVLPVVEVLAGVVEVPLSIDTTKAVVARAAVRAGAHIINDISASRFDPEMARVAAETGAGLVLSHIQGTPQTMQRSPQYDDLLDEIRGGLEEAMAAARAAGVADDAVVIDPGIGFGKTASHNWEILAGLEALAPLGRPILVGASRKRFLRDRVGAARSDLEAASLAVHVAAWLHGACIARVHDVRAHCVAAQVLGPLLAAKNRTR